MALFNKEPDRNIKPQQDLPKAGIQPAQTTPPVATVDERAVRANGPTAGLPPHPEGRAYLDRGTKISGKLFFEGATRIDGQVDGEIGANDSLVVGESAVVTAHIKAAAVTIAGKVSGDIVASKRIEIRPTAKVMGNLTTPVLVVHEGALFEGHCAMHSDGARDRANHQPDKPVAKDERVMPVAALKQA